MITKSTFFFSKCLRRETLWNFPSEHPCFDPVRHTTPARTPISEAVTARSRLGAPPWVLLSHELGSDRCMLRMKKSLIGISVTQLRGGPQSSRRCFVNFLIYKPFKVSNVILRDKQ